MVNLLDFDVRTQKVDAAKNQETKLDFLLTDLLVDFCASPIIPLGSSFCHNSRFNSTVCSRS